MPALALFAWANLGHDLKALWGWLCHRSFWQLAFGAAAIFALIQHFQLADCRSDRTRGELQLQKMSKPKNEQKVETGKRIKAGKQRVRHADDRAKVIEQAPLPGQCKSPPEIMSADL